LGGGNIDIRLLGVGSTFYLPVFAEGALFYAGHPHLAMGNGEVCVNRDGGAGVLKVGTTQALLWAAGSV
jgi:acetamidase/formamidase